MDEPAIAILMVFALSGFTLVSSHRVCYNGMEYDLNSNNPHRWVLPYEDPCEYAAVLGGLTTQNASHQQGAPYYLDQIVIRLSKFFGCQNEQKGIECSNPQPLGIEDGTIPDESFSASSSYNSEEGRLNGYAWQSSLVDVNSWLEVDLGESIVVSGVITQGWVTQFKMKYKKLQSSGYDYVKDRYGDIQVFQGNIVDATTPVTNMFDQSIVATIVCVEPEVFLGAVGLQVKLIGCHIN